MKNMFAGVCGLLILLLLLLTLFHNSWEYVWGGGNGLVLSATVIGATAAACWLDDRLRQHVTPEWETFLVRVIAGIAAAVIVEGVFAALDFVKTGQANISTVELVRFGLPLAAVTWLSIPIAGMLARWTKQLVHS